VAKSKNDAINASVARMLRERRIALGLSMYAVAKRARISHSTMSRIENELMKPTLDMLLRIAEVMEINLWSLIKEAEERVKRLD
jgi:transcriptional regulator with XRE-family HTH domain